MASGKCGGRFVIPVGQLGTLLAERDGMSKGDLEHVGLSELDCSHHLYHLAIATLCDSSASNT